MADRELRVNRYFVMSRNETQPVLFLWLIFMCMPTEMLLLLQWFAPENQRDEALAEPMTPVSLL